MSDIAIRVENIGKRYRIGERSQGAFRYKSLRDSISSIFQHSSTPPLHHSTNTIWALKDVSFEVKRGEVVGIIGRNGAGKSTLLKILSRITEPTEGKAEIHGRVASLLEVGTGFHPELTGRENIYLNGAILGMRKVEIARKFDEIVAFAEVEKFIDTPVKHYSSGMYVRLAFAVAAHLEPEILLVDEVLSVGDVSFQKKCIGTMKKVAGHGRTVIIVSHQLETITNLCSRAILLQRGMVKEQGETSEIVDRYLDFSRQLTSQSLQERTDRLGDGRVRLTETWIEDSAGKQTDLVQSGATIKIVAQYMMRGPTDPKKLLVAFAIYGKNGVQLTDLSNRTTGDEFAVDLPQSGRFECVIPRLPLNAGYYTYNVIVRSGMAVEDFVTDAGRFQVESGDFFNTGKTVDKNQGMLLVDHHWQAGT